MEVKEGQYIKAVQLAKIIGISDRHLRRLAEENVIKKNGQGRYYFIENVQAYISYVENLNDAPADLKEEKMKEEIKKTKKDVELKDIKIKELKNELHPAEVIKRVMTNVLVNIKGKFLAMPNKIAPLVIGLENLGEIQEVIDTEIRDILLDISEYDAETFKTNEVYEDEEDE